MKFSIPTADLADVVTWTARVLPTRPAVPALAGLLLAAGTDGLMVSAVDYDTSRRRTVAAEIGEPGRVLVPGRVLAEVVKALPAGKLVELAGSGAELVITCGSATFTLPTMPLDDYPSLPEPMDGTGTINGREFAAAVAQVVRGTSKDTTLPMLAGIRLDITSDTITMASTDRYRMVSREVAWHGEWLPGAPSGVVIPGAVLAEIVKSMPEGEVTLALSDTLASIQGGGAVATVRLFDEQFVDYKARLLAEDFTTWATVDVHELSAAVRRVALMVERAAAIHLEFTKGQVLVRAGGEDGRASEIVPGVTLDGADIEIAFQPQFLLDGLLGIDSDQVRIGMTTSAKPALLLPAGDDDPDYRYLVMALRVAS